MERLGGGYDWDLGDTTAFMLATSRRSDVLSLSHHHSPLFPLCGGMWQLRLTVDSGSAAQNVVPMVGVHAILVERHRCAAGPTTANFTLRLEAERDPPAVGSSHEYHHVGKSFGVGTGWGKLDLVKLEELAAAQRVRVCLTAVSSICAVRDDFALPGIPRTPQGSGGSGRGYATDAEAVAAVVHGLDQLADTLDSFVEGGLVLDTQPFQLRVYASGASDREQESASCVGFSMTSQAPVPLALTFRLRVFIEHADVCDHAAARPEKELVSYHCVQRLGLSESWWCDAWISRASLSPVPDAVKLQFDQISIMTFDQMFQPVPTTPRLDSQQLALAESNRKACGVVAHVTGLYGLMAALNDTNEALTTESFVLAGSSWTLAIQQTDGAGVTAESSPGAHISRGAIAVDLLHEGFESVAVSAEVVITVAGRLLYHGMPAAQLHTRSDDRCLRTIFPARLLTIPDAGHALPEDFEDKDHVGCGDLKIEVTNVQQSELIAGAETPRAAGSGRSTAFVWSMKNYAHLVSLATRMDGWYVASSHFSMRGRDWSLRVYPNGDEMFPGSAGKLVTRVVLESNAWTWAAFVVELSDEHGNPFAPDGASPRQIKYLKMSQFTNTRRDLACVFSNKAVWNECVRALISGMVVIGMETQEDGLIWTIDGFESLPLTTRDDVSFTFHRGGCKWKLALFNTRDNDLGVKMECLSDSAVVASFTVSFETDLAGEVGRQRVANRDFGQNPSISLVFKRKVVFAGNPGVARLKLTAMCCSWASVSASLEAKMSETSEHDSKLGLRHLNDASLQTRKPSGTALLNITLCAERQPLKVRWIVTVRNAGKGVGVGVAVRGAVNLDGDDVLHREIVARIKRDVSLGDLSSETEAETEMERQLRQACSDGCMDVQSSEEFDFELAEWRQALVRVLMGLRRDGLMELGRPAFDNVSTMVREALLHAAAAKHWKEAAGLLQLASHYRSETGEHVNCALFDVAIIQHSDFWDNIYVARCEHERQQAELQVSTPEEKRLVAENTYLAQALILLATMQDMKISGTKRHAFVQCTVDSGYIASHSANVWFADFVDNEPIISPATDGGLMPDEDSADHPGRRTFSELSSENNACCAVLECPDQPEAGVPMDPAVWTCTIPPAGTGGVAVVGCGDKLCLEWVHAPEHGCGFLKIQNHSRENSWAYTREVRTDTTREQRWRPAVWLDGGAQVEVRGKTIWTRRPRPPARPRAPVCTEIVDAADAVCLTWEHDPRSGDAPVTEYVIQSRKRRQNGGGWIADWQLHSRHVPVNGEGSHAFKLTPLTPDGGRWTFRVVARSLGGQSEPSDPCRLWTTPALPLISNFKLIRTTATSAEVSFDPVSWPTEGFDDGHQRRLCMRQREETSDRAVPAVASHAIETPQRKTILPVEHGVFSTAQYFRVRHLTSVWRDFTVQPGEEPVGQLAPEDVVEVVQTRTTSGGYVRLRIKLGSTSGWVDSADVTTGAAYLRRMGTGEVESWVRGEASGEVAPASPGQSVGVSPWTPATQVAASPARTSITVPAVDETTASAASTTNHCYYAKTQHQAVAPARVQSASEHREGSHRRAGSLPEAEIAPNVLNPQQTLSARALQMSLEASPVQTRDHSRDGATNFAERTVAAGASADSSSADDTIPAITYPEELEVESQACEVLQLQPRTRYTLMLEASVDNGTTISTLEFSTDDDKVRAV